VENVTIIRSKNEIRKGETMYDIIIYRRKINKVKVIVCALIFIFIISSSAIMGMKCAMYARNDQYTNTMLAKVEALKEDEEAKAEQIRLQQQIAEEERRSKQLTIEQVDTLFNDEQKVAYLTFDDGPSSLTGGILDILAKEQIKATFFMLGTRVEQAPETVQRMYKEGHYLANHGYSHNYSSIYSNAQTVWDEYALTEQAIQNALQEPNYHSNLFRFPGGSHGGVYHDIKQEAKQFLRDNGVASLDWNALTKDAEGANTVEAVLQNLYETVGEKQHVVLLMHDAGSKHQTYEALPTVISYLREKGYAFKNMYDLIP